jgi:ParB family chromosome partitioning protein
MIHRIKIYEPYAEAVAEGRKTFEVRINDRGYNCGDFVRFRVFEDGFERQYHPLTDMTFRITYVHSGLGLQEGYVVFGIEKVEEGESNADRD